MLGHRKPKKANKTIDYRVPSTSSLNVENEKKRQVDN